MQIVTRYDFVPFDDKAKTDANGFIHDTPVITRTGIFTYYEPDGSVRKELRLPQDVFEPDSLASYEGVPLTFQHPKGLVSPDNADEIPIVGSVLSPGIQDGNNVRAKIVIQSQKVAKSGMRGLSAGYTATVIPETGTWDGQEYTHRQTNIRLNHVAVCKNPRAGAVARLNMDSEEILEDELLSSEQRKNLPDDAFGLPEKRAYPMPDKSHAQNALARAAQELKTGNLTQEEYEKIVGKAKSILKNDEGVLKPMAKVKLQNGCEYEVPQEVAAEIDSLCKQNKDVNEKLSKMTESTAADKAATKKKMDEIEAERDTFKVEVAKFDEKLKAKDKEHADSLNDLVRQRVSLLSVATAHKIEKADEMTDRQIKESVIKAVRGDDMDLSEKADAYIDAAFDFCKGDTKGRSDAMEAQRKAVGNKKSKAERDDEAETSTDARQRMIERTMGAYKGGKE